MPRKTNEKKSTPDTFNETAEHQSQGENLKKQQEQITGRLFIAKREARKQ